MDFNLADYSQTLALGAIFAFCALFLTRCFLPTFTLEKLASGSQSPTSIRTAVLLSLLYAIGVVAEDFAERSTATQSLAERQVSPFHISRLTRFLLRDNNTQRLHSLFHPVKFSDDAIEAIGNNLLLEVMSYTCFTNKKDFNWLKTELKPSKFGRYNKIKACGVENVDKLLSVVNALYYDAKNAVYLKPTFFKELSTIDARLHFLRALTLMCALFALIYTVALILVTVARRPYITRRDKWKMVSMILALVMSAYVASAAYAIEHRNYDRRVFGYFRHHRCASALTSEGTEANQNAGRVDSPVTRQSQ